MRSHLFAALLLLPHFSWAEDPPHQPKSSVITIQNDSIPLDEAIRIITAQTGNKIDPVLPWAGQSKLYPELKLNLRDAPFWSALNSISDQAGIRFASSVHKGELYMLRGSAKEQPTAIDGPFQLTLNRIIDIEDFQLGRRTAYAEVELAWEPRYRLMMLELPEMNKDSAVPRSPQRIRQAGWSNLTLDIPERIRADRELISEWEVKFSAWVSQGMITFKQKKLTGRAAQRKDNLRFQITNSSTDDSVWTIKVRLDYPAGQICLESNDTWIAAENEMALVSGKRSYRSLGHEVTVTDDGKVFGEYVFRRPRGDPSQYGLEYTAPAPPVNCDLRFRFTPSK